MGTVQGAALGGAQGVQSKDAAPVVKRRVQLAATPIGPPLPQLLQAYHTSVIVDDMEFSFSGRGIDQLRGTLSHVPFAGKPTVIDMGYTKTPRREMVRYLQPHFMPGTYDLLRKNCNSFSDCCLTLLLDRRLDEKYRTMEKIGAVTDEHTAVVRLFTGGGYKPNPRSQEFKSCKVVERIQEKRGPRSHQAAERAQDRPPARPGSRQAAERPSARRGSGEGRSR